MNIKSLPRKNNPNSPLRVILLIIALIAIFAQPAVVLAVNVNLAWNASASPNVGGYVLSYGSAPGVYNTSTDVGAGTSFQVTGLQAGSTYYMAVKAYDTLHKTESAYSNEVKAVIPAVTTPPPATLSANFSANVRSGTDPLTVAFTDASTGTITSWLWNFGDGGTSTAKNPSHIYKTGTYNVSLTVSGSGTSATKTQNAYITASSVTTGNPSPSTPPNSTASSLSNSLVAAYGFEEVGGNTVVDASGLANHATLTGGAARAAGHSGKAVILDGVNDFLSVNDSASLDLTTGFTMTAWIKPQATKTGSILTKEQTGGAVYALYASKEASLPFSAFNDGSAYRATQGTTPLALNAWSNLAAVYDQHYLRLYLNGKQIDARPYSGAVQTSTGALRIGGNSIWGDYFKGLIDEVKIYRRALSPTELQTDLKSAVSIIKPKQILIGSDQLEPSTDSNPQNMAEAFSVVAAKNATITTIRVYLENGSATSGIIAGIYTDNQGHPGKLLSQGKLITANTGTTNAVGIPAANIEAGKTYWLAVLSPNGVIKFRDRMGQGGSPMETSASSTLTTLPLNWTTGQTYNDGPMSVYGKGY